KIRYRVADVEQIGRRNIPPGGQGDLKTVGRHQRDVGAIGCAVEPWRDRQLGPDPGVAERDGTADSRADVTLELDAGGIGFDAVVDDADARHQEPAVQIGRGRVVAVK